MHHLTPTPNPMWLLHAEQHDPETFRLLPGARKTLGRAPRADFVVDVAMVSRLHCRLAVSEDGVLEVEDLRSTNGTFVNGRRVNRAVLIPGDRLQVGRLELRVAREPLPSPEPA